jgi:uncharacterized membrane protein YfcA
VSRGASRVLVGGVLSGLFGIGGGLVVVPALILVAGFPIAIAAGTSSMMATGTTAGMAPNPPWWSRERANPLGGLRISTLRPESD